MSSRLGCNSTAAADGGLLSVTAVSGQPSARYLQCCCSAPGFSKEMKRVRGLDPIEIREFQQFLIFASKSC